MRFYFRRVSCTDTDCSMHPTMGKRKCSCLIAQPCTATAHFRLCEVGLQPIPNQSQYTNSLGLSGSRIRPQVAVEQAAGQVSQPPLSLILWSVAAQRVLSRHRAGLCQRGTNLPRSLPQEQDSAKKNIYRAPQTGPDAPSLTAFNVRLHGTLSCS